MTYKKYLQLVQYIIQIGDQQNQKRSFKYPFISVQILTISNKHTQKYFTSQGPIIQQEIIIEQYQIQQQIDSDLSFISSRSQGSIISDQSQAEKQTHKDKDDNQNQQNQQDNLNFIHNTIGISQMPQIHNINMEKRLSQIDQDDFPFMEQIKKTKKVKKKRQKIIVKQYEPLLKKLLNYFDKSLNHTLTGYVCKVINSLLTANSSIYPQILIKAQGSLLSDHLQSRSTEQLLIRLLSFQNQDQNDIKLQYNLILLCLHKIFQNTQSMVIQNLSFLVCQILNKFSTETNLSVHHQKLIKQLIRLTFFYKVTQYFEQTIKKLQASIKNNINQNLEIIQTKILSFAKIFTNFLQIFLKIRDKQNFQQICQQVLNDYEDNFNKFVEIAYKRIQFQTRNINLNKLFKKFGMTKILLINVILILIKQNLGYCQQILAEKNEFLQILLKLVEKSPLNNILHNSVFSIYNILLQNSIKKNSKVVLGSLFRQIFEIESQYCLLKFSYNTLKYNKNLCSHLRKGYAGHLLKTCELINSIEQVKDQQSLQRFKNSNQWQYIIKQFLISYIQQNKRTLGNYQKRKNTMASIQFNKADILQNYKEFLKGTKFTTLDEFNNFVDDTSQQSDSQDYQNVQHTLNNSKQVQRQIQQEEIHQFMVNYSMQENPKQFNIQTEKPNDQTKLQ